MAEAYITPFIATPNSVIESSAANAGYAANIRFFRQFLPDTAIGDIGKALILTAEDAADWTSIETVANALALGGVAAAGYPTLAAGGDFAVPPTLDGSLIPKYAYDVYIGDGGSSARVIPTGFVVQFFAIFEAPNSTMYICINSVTTSLRIAPGLTQGSASVHIASPDGFTVADGTAQGNADGLAYTWVALGQ
jgi:hypothetical protein